MEFITINFVFFSNYDIIILNNIIEVLNLYFFYSLIFFIILNIINLIILYNKTKLKTIVLTIGIVSLIFSTYHIFLLNSHYINAIIKEFYNSEEQITTFFNIVNELNITFGIVSLVLTLILSFLFIKIKYKSLHKLTIIILFVTSSILFFYKGIIITKTIIDFSLLSWCLICYYLNFATIPLLIKRYKEKVL